MIWQTVREHLCKSERNMGLDDVRFPPLISGGSIEGAA